MAGKRGPGVHFSSFNLQKIRGKAPFPPGGGGVSSPLNQNVFEHKSDALEVSNAKTHKTVGVI